MRKIKAALKAAAKWEREGGSLRQPEPFVDTAFDQFKAMLDHGTGAAQGAMASDRRAAMEAMDMLRIRDPHRLGELLARFDQGSAFVELLNYRASRRVGV